MRRPIRCRDAPGVLTVNTDQDVGPDLADGLAHAGQARADALGQRQWVVACRGAHLGPVAAPVFEPSFHLQAASTLTTAPTQKGFNRCGTDPRLTQGKGGGPAPRSGALQSDPMDAAVDAAIIGKAQRPAAAASDRRWVRQPNNAAWWACHAAATQTNSLRFAVLIVEDAEARMSRFFRSSAG